MRAIVVVAALALPFGCGKGGDASKGSAGSAGSAAAPAGSATATPSAAAPAAPAAPSAAVPSGGAHVLGRGDPVAVQWENGKWYPGRINAVNADGTYDVFFDDGDRREAVPAAEIKYMPAKTDWKVGDRVQGRFTDGVWYPGKIAAVNADGTYKVAYDDGDVSEALPLMYLRTIPDGM
jgi:hypothetical protein